MKMLAIICDVLRCWTAKTLAEGANPKTTANMRCTDTNARGRYFRGRENIEIILDRMHMERLRNLCV